MDLPLPKDSARPARGIEYPDSDGELMADNTEQFLFIQTFQGNLDGLLPDFVAGDHLWYPVEGHPEIRVAPDVYVALGRPKGHRGSYKQWEEAGVPPRVVFEWWSPKNHFPQQTAKLRFYERYGVEEFYAFDEVRRGFGAFVREGASLEPVNTEGGITSRLLGIRMELVGDDLRAWGPDGRPFRSHAELMAAQVRVEAERDRALRERDEAAHRAAALAARLRELGIDPDAR